MFPTHHLYIKFVPILNKMEPNKEVPAADENQGQSKKTGLDLLLTEAEAVAIVPTAAPIGTQYQIPYNYHPDNSYNSSSTSTRLIT